jgi:hypothetical protein
VGDLKYDRHDNSGGGMQRRAIEQRIELDLAAAGQHDLRPG